MVALASAFVRVRPQIDKREFTKAGEDAGTAAGQGAGKNYGEGFKRGADGRLRDHRGKFVTDSEASGLVAGGKAGDGFGKGFGKGSGKIVKSLKANLSLAAGVFVPLGLAGAVGAIAKIGIAYEDNLNIFKTVTKATGAEMVQVAEKARQLGADVKLPGVSAAGAAAAMTELGKAGFTVQQSMDAASATLQLARVANISEAEAAEVAANAVNAFGISAKDTGFVVDELAAAANSSSIEVTEASASFKQAAAVFSGLQGPAVGGKEAITELSTAIAILGNNGIKGSDAGTSLKQALLQLTAPAGPAKAIMIELAAAAGGATVSLKQQTDVLYGGTKARETAINAIDQMNPKLKDQGNIAYDSAGKMRSLPQIIDLVTRGTAKMSQEDRNAAITKIFGADATRSILALMKGGLPTYEAQRKAILQQGAASDFAAAKNAGLGGAIDNVKSQFENAAISIYNVAKGPLTKALTGFASALPGIFANIAAFAGYIHQNIGVIRDWAVAIGIVTAAIKLNSFFLAVQAAGGLVGYIKGIKIVSSTTRLWALAQTYLNASLIANPIGIAVIAIAALVAGLVLAYRHSEQFRAIVDAVGRALKTAFTATVNFLVNTVFPALVTAYNSVANAALWLWHKVIEPVWHGIQSAIQFAVAVVKVAIAAAVAEFRMIASVVTWLYRNIFQPVFNVIGKVVEIWWLAVRVIFAALVAFIGNQIRPVFVGLRNLANTIFSAIGRFIATWWEGVKVVFGYFRTYILGPLKQGLDTANAFFGRIFRAIGALISGWWHNNVSPILTAVRTGWNNLALGFSIIYNSKIKPLFEAFIGFIKKNVVGGFQTGVSAIKTAWDKVQEYARKPVAFVVNHVINPFINGLNSAAKLVGIKDAVAPIKGFASGGKISGTGGMTDNRQAVIPGVGAVQLQGGEFVVNRQDTGKALPLLKWINSGMKGGMSAVASRIGRPLTDYPGDGSEGWAFKDGGLIGWAKDVWGAISDPIGTLKKPFESALSNIPGGGTIKDFLVGSAKKLLGGAINWLKSFGGDGSGKYTGPKGGRIGAAASFVQSQAGKPYIWADAGPDGYDCSGIVSAAYNVLKGRSPYSHTFSTESLPGGFFRPGAGGPLLAGWSHPGQAPAGASVGHMAGQIAGLPFESRGSRGVIVGKGARRVGQFANHGFAGLRDGGLFGEPVRLFDKGGFWPSGTLGANMSGRTEYVNPKGQSAPAGGDTFVFGDGAFSGAVMTNSKQAEDLVVNAINSARSKRRIK